MIYIYTTPSCSSCRKAKKWLETHQVKYIEKNLLTCKLDNDDLNFILKHSENGFEDIISKRSKPFIENNLDIEKMGVKELKEFIINNPSVLRRPIIVDDNRVQVGYNDDEIRIFIPKRLREIIMCTNCTGEDEDCDYKTALKLYLAEIKQNLYKNVSPYVK